MSQLFASMTLQMTPLFPRWLILTLVGALIGAVLFGALVMARRKISWRWNGFLALVRCACIAVFALMLLQPRVSSTGSAAAPGSPCANADTMPPCARSW